MKSYDQSVKINHNSNYPYTPDHLYRILIIGGSGSGKTNPLLNLMKHQGPDIDKIDLHFKDPLESKYQLHINKKEKVEIEILKNPKAFIDYSKLSGGVYENFEHYNPTRKRRVSIVFDDMIADMGCNKKLSPIVTELFLMVYKYLGQEFDYIVLDLVTQKGVYLYMSNFEKFKEQLSSKKKFYSSLTGKIS